MNRVYLFGKIVFKSKLKYIVSPKLQVFLEIVIETISKEKFKCIAYETLCNDLANIEENTYIVIMGNVQVSNYGISINIEEYEVLE